ncbi:MAG: DNA replication and repair protein RecF [Tidjanibacter sp.]|nr:DNA replication and repair protein RecF [Tidjanibacter sp.]
MRINRLTILNFKNIAECELRFDAAVNCFVGGNGAGKTNLIDAIHILSMTKSAFSMTDGQCLRHGEEFFMLSGAFTADSGTDSEVVCSFRKGDGKLLKYCGKEYDRLADHIGVIPSVVVSPSDIALVADEADLRRRWLNSFISQSDRTYLDSVMRYNRLLSERNSLLKQPVANDVLEVFDMRLSELGEVIHTARESAVELLQPLVADGYRNLSDDAEQVELSYRSELNGCPMSEILLSSREKDMAMGFTTSGIHRDDMVMTIGGYPLRRYGSQGQQKSFLIALKLAQYRLLSRLSGERPMLLFDDLFDKLDSERLERLLRMTSGEEFGQIFISDCNVERLRAVLDKSALSYRFFTVTEGTITPEE